MKKIITWLLIAVMVVACMPITAFAAEAGETVVVSVYAGNNPGFAAYYVQLSYDESVFELTDFSAGALSSGTFDENVANKSVAFMTGSDMTGDGVLFTATFVIKSGAAAGTYPVSASLGEAYNSNLDDVSFNVSADSVTVTVPECNHVWDEGQVTIPATCETAGVKTYTCTVDGCGVTKTEEISALGHAWDEGKVTTPAGCETEGEITYTCKNDSTHTKTEPIAAAGHKWDEGKVTTPATCETAGVKTYTCTVDGCGKTKTEEVAALGHAWDEGKVTTPATCEEDGVKTYTCKNDSTHTKTEVIKATGHHWEWIVDKKATGSETGLKHEECSECGAKRNENTVIPKIEGLDDVPQTGDITPQIIAAVVTVMALFAAAFVFAFKRKAV